eukprot:gb/GECG01012466.1/.p1 GENE.gb/GECG01012466.1/~~gb/GECG01012466.1/.p1  ORF type:complete len:210 (+),score=36.34 gb/GECG01012466.1/:1-630(+)
MKLFEGTMLGGGVLRLQWANVDYLTKLEREWQQSSLSQNKGNLSNQESQHDHSTGGNLSAASPAIPKNFRIRRRKGESMFKVPSAPVELGKYPLSSTASSVQEAGSRRKRAGVPERMMFEDDTANVLGNVQRNIRGELDTNDEIPGESAWSKSTESVMKQYDKKTDLGGTKENRSATKGRGATTEEAAYTGKPPRNVTEYLWKARRLHG